MLNHNSQKIVKVTYIFQSKRDIELRDQFSDVLRRIASHNYVVNIDEYVGGRGGNNPGK